MRSPANRKTPKKKHEASVKKAEPAVARRAFTLAPRSALASGAGAYALLMILVDHFVIRTPEGNPNLQTALLVLLGLAFILAAQGLLAVIRAISADQVWGWPLAAAAVGSLAYSLAFGRRVFVNTWNYDDWGYLVPHSLHITQSLNDHFAPLLNIVLWAMQKIFGFDYMGAACLQQTAFLTIILVFAHLLWIVSRQPWLTIFWVGLFAMWPSYGSARTWFGGGFWLTASAAFLFLYVLHTRRVVLAGSTPEIDGLQKAGLIPNADLAISLVLASATVFISSQTLLPALFLVAFCGPAVLFSQHFKAAFRRLAVICALSLVPTALALWGRSVYIPSTPFNPSGLRNGQLFSNLAVFVLNKVFLIDPFQRLPSDLDLYRTRVYFFCILTLLAAGIRLATTRSLNRERRGDLAGLIIGGYTVLLISVIQIGAGRRWSVDAVINAYYVTLPFLGLALAWGGTAFALLVYPKRVRPAEPLPATKARPKKIRRKDYSAALHAIGASIATGAIVAAAYYSPQLSSDPPLSPGIPLIRAQWQFLDSLGAATCDLASVHRQGPAVHWVPRSDISECKECRAFIGPPQYMRDLGFESFARVAARHSCPAADLTKIFPPNSVVESAAVTDGRESQALALFVQRYLNP